MNEKVIMQAQTLSSGTMAVLTGFHKYDILDKIRWNFVEYVVNSMNEYKNWQEAWNSFYDGNDI